MADTDRALILPSEVVLHQQEIATPRFTPRELRMISDHLGRSFTQIVTDEESDDKFSVMAWLKLRRDGYLVSWEDMDDIVITVAAGDQADPTNGSRPVTSPRSAGSGE